MTLNIYLEFLTPPGAVAAMWQPRDKPGNDFEEVMQILFGAGMHHAMKSIQEQIIEAGRMVVGEESTEDIMAKWMENARPVAFVMFSAQLYTLGYCPHFTQTHPMVQQVWNYLKTALDLVSDDFRDSKITYNLSGLKRYERNLPARIAEALAKLPPLEIP